MPGLNDNQLELLRHTDRTIINQNAICLLNFLWNSTSNQAYIQRNVKFDNTYFNKSSRLYFPCADYHTFALMYTILNLNNANIEENMNNLEDRLSQEFSSSNNKMYILKNSKKSLLYNFDDKIRNAIAHGTFNIQRDGQAEFFGQTHATRESKINFYLRIDDFQDIVEFYNDLHQCVNNILDLQIITFRRFKEVDSIHSNLIRSGERFIIFDNDFSFVEKNDNADNQVNKLKNRILYLINKFHLQKNDNIDFFIPIETNVKQSTLRVDFPNFNLIKPNNILDYYEINKTD